MAKRKASILDEIRELPVARGAWLASLPAKERTEIEKVKRAFKAKELDRISQKALIAFILDRFALNCTEAAVLQWLQR